MDELKIIRRSENGLQVFTPFDSRFPEKMRSLHGTWDKPGKCWWVAATQLGAVREAMREVFGRDDLTGKDTVSLILRFPYGDGTYKDDHKVFGKVLCHATSKSSGGTAGEDVHFLQGQPESGGSVNNWCSVIPPGSVIRLDNVRKQELDREILPKSVSMEILSAADTTGHEALIQERNALLQRIQEIDSLLGIAKDGAG